MWMVLGLKSLQNISLWNEISKYRYYKNISSWDEMWKLQLYFIVGWNEIKVQEVQCIVTVKLQLQTSTANLIIFWVAKI